MPKLTISNIPKSIYEKLWPFSQKQVLHILDLGIAEIEKESRKSKISLNKETQIQAWKTLLGKWEDKRTTKNIIKDIYESRTTGRKIKL